MDKRFTIINGNNRYGLLILSQPTLRHKSHTAKPETLVMSL